MPRREGTKKQIIGRLVDDLSQETFGIDNVTRFYLDDEPISEKT